MRRIHPLAAVGSGVAIAGLVFGAAVASPNAPLAQSTVPVNPTQQEALDGLETAKRYIQQHPDATPTPTPTVSETATPTPTSTTPTPTVTTTPPAGAYPSGLPWSNGAFTMHSASNATAMEAWLGKNLDNFEVFTSRGNWGAQLNPWWRSSLPASFDKAREDLIISVPLWTDDGNRGSDAQWRELADQIEATDPDAIVRHGWEFNCCYSRLTDPAAWKAQYNRSVDLMQSAAPNLHFSWNPNEGVSSNGVTIPPDQAWPGPANVDSISLDAYDWYKPYNSAANWADHRDKKYGWNYWYNFARSHNKPFGLAEWGLYSARSESGGDNPLYFRYVFDWLREKASNAPGSIRFVTYFNETASYYQGHVHPTSRNPNGAAEYRAQVHASAR